MGASRIPSVAVWALIALVLVSGAYIAGRISTSPGAQPVVPGSVDRHLINEGYIYFDRTQRHLGPFAPLVSDHYARATMNCSSCHINAGINPHFLDLRGVGQRYPKPYPKTGLPESLADRVNQCMERSMNGKPLPQDSRPLLAMVAYLESLPPPPDPSKLEQDMLHLGVLAPTDKIYTAPSRPGDPQVGQHLFMQNCASCHGPDGQGLRTEAGGRPYFSIPPLWGEFSFNKRAGMAGQSTATRFIFEYMPLDNPHLSIDEAHDVAAFILSQARPE